MKPEGSLPHSQVAATCPYPEPDESSPYPTHPGSPMWSLSLRFPHQNPVHAFPLLHTPGSYRKYKNTMTGKNTEYFTAEAGDTYSLQFALNTQSNISL
jgi:hypothetical protein